MSDGGHFSPGVLLQKGGTCAKQSAGTLEVLVRRTGAVLSRDNKIKTGDIFGVVMAVFGVEKWGKSGKSPSSGGVRAT